MTVRSRGALLAALLLAPAAGAQSLWKARQSAPSLIADTSAREIGDLLTIVIRERQIVENEETTALERTTSLDAILESFQVLPNLFEPLPDAKGTAKRTFDGKAQYDKEGRLETRIAAVVIDVQPNGNIVVEGRRRVIVNSETKTIRITGIVRPFDVLGNNEVYSEDVANASIGYEGEGQLTASTDRGWFGALLDIIWPF